MKITNILLALLLMLSVSTASTFASDVTFGKSDFVSFNKNDDKDSDDSDGNAGEPQKRGHKGKKHKHAE